MAEDAADAKAIIKSVLSSSTNKFLTVAELQKDYKSQMGENLPYRKFGFESTYSFLKNFTDFEVILDEQTFLR